MNLSEIIDAVVHIYFRNFWLFVAVAAVVYVPYGALSALVQAGENTKAIDRLQHHATLTSYQVHVLIGQAFNLTPLRIAVLLATVLFALVALPVELAAVTKVGADRYEQQQTSFRIAFQQARQRWLPLLGVSLLIGLIALGAVLVLALVSVVLVLALRDVGILLVVLLAIAAVVLGVMAYLRVVVAVPVVVLEGVGPWSALNRSWHLSRGHGWLIFGVILVITIVSGIFGAVLGGVAGAMLASPGGATSVAARVVLALVSILAQILVSPISALAAVLLYFNLRGRREPTFPDEGSPRPVWQP
jgi:hypothetical protein